MAKKSKIEWTDATWNPWYGCTKVSAGCDNCYSEQWHKRCGRDFNKITIAKPTTFDAPLKWKKPMKIFVCSLGDFFHDDVPRDTMLNAVEIIKKCPQHTFIILTKRPELISSAWLIPDNVWLGVSVENQETANERIPLLLKTNAKVKFISYEPALGPINLHSVVGGTQWIGGQRGCSGKHQHGYHHSNGTSGKPLHHHHDIRCRQGLDWVIAGGESGGKARPCHPNWIRAVKNQCKLDGVPFFFKQWGKWVTPKQMTLEIYYDINDATGIGHEHSPCGVGKKRAGNELDGKQYMEFPA